MPRRFLVDLIPNINAIFEKNKIKFFLNYLSHKSKYMTINKLNWDTLRKNFLWAKILALRGKFLNSQKIHFFDMGQKK